MIYSEAAYFDGNHCHHCATRDEHSRLSHIHREAVKRAQRRNRMKGIFQYGTGRRETGSHAIAQNGNG